MPNITRARTGPKPRPVAERFWRLVDRLGSDECWLWRGGKNAFGHGTVWNGVCESGAHGTRARARERAARKRPLRSRRSTDGLHSRAPVRRREHSAQLQGGASLPSL